MRTTRAGGVRGFDGAKGVQGRKRHLLVDTEGLVLAQDVSAAHVSDQAGARRLLSGLRPLQPRLELIWADGACAGHPLFSWAAEQGLRIEVVRREEGQRGFAVQPRRWVVERTFARLGRSRGLAKDHERRLQSAEAMIKLSMIHLMLRRLARHGSPAKQALSPARRAGPGHAAGPGADGRPPIRADGVAADHDPASDTPSILGPDPVFVAPPGRWSPRTPPGSAGWRTPPPCWRSSARGAPSIGS